LQDTLKALDIGTMSKAVEAIRKAGRVEVVGIGSAAAVAEDTNYRLLRIGVESCVSVDSHIQAITASLAGEKTAVITISHSGSGIEALTATRLARKRAPRRSPSPILASRHYWPTRTLS
jgi:DNA-binding MurR/RpiR family transcriptional regulator